MFNRSVFVAAIFHGPSSRIAVLAAGFLLAIGWAPAALGIVATTTQLSVPMPTVAVGVPTLLVATVTDASNNPVLVGTVTFYDGSRALGSAQIVSRAGGSFTQGTANLKTASFSRGTNSITAVFAGTKTDSSSTSAAKTVTVTGKLATSTVLSESLLGGEYSLTAALQAFGLQVPTGSIDFVDTTSNVSLGAIPLSGATWSGDLVTSSTPSQAVLTRDCLV